MVRKWELGRPVERLREQMERLQLSLSDRTFTRLLEERLAAAEERIRGLERESYATDMSLRRLEEEKHAAEARAEEIERSVRAIVDPIPMTCWRRHSFFNAFCRLQSSSG